MTDNLIVYKCIHKKLNDILGSEVIVKKEIVYHKLGEIYHVPKRLRFIVIKEMCDLAMLEIINRDNIKINKTSFNPEEVKVNFA